VALEIKLFPVIRKILILPLFILLTGNWLYAQEFNKEIELIKNQEYVFLNPIFYPDERPEIATILNKYRQEAKQALLNGDMKKFNEFASIETAHIGVRRYYIFSYWESMIFSILLEDYSNFFNKIKEPREYPSISKDEKKIYRFLSYSYQEFYYLLSEFLKENGDKIEQTILSANVNDEEKRFLNLYLDNFIYDSDPCDIISKNKLMSDASSFENKYSESFLAEYSKKFISYDYVPSNFSFGGFFNSGIIIPDQKLRTYLSPSIPTILSMELKYKRMIFSVGLGPSWGQKINKEFEYDTLWLKNDKTGLSTGEIGFSYNFIETDRINIAPSIGLRGAGIFAPSEKGRYKDIENILSSNSFNYGLNLDFKWGYKSCGQNPLIGRQGSSKKFYKVIRIGFIYQDPSFEKNQADLQGSLYTLKLSIGGYEHFAKRKK
jgi:hypothetical protein